MAIVTDYTTSDGVNHPEAYARVTALSLDWARQISRMEITIHHNQAARTADKPPILVANLKLNRETTPTFSQVYGTEELDIVNPIKRTYTYLKLLNEWKTWSDVI